MDKLIAKFFGVEPDEKNFYDGWELQKSGLPFLTGIMGNGTRDLPFDREWDWLMPVVGKIENITDRFVVVTIEGNSCTISAEDKDGLYYKVTLTRNSKIESTYEAVVSFIKWYNEI